MAGLPPLNLSSSAASEAKLSAQTTLGDQKFGAINLGGFNNKSLAIVGVVILIIVIVWKPWKKGR